MCGIAGFLSDRETPAAREAAVDRMCEVMRHRGPDDAGLHSSGPLTLGMRRLAIFDPAHGHQPMVTDDGRHALVFNGALYNFRELRGELEGHGFRFRTDCDTEVLLAACICWGRSCLGRLRGMFAFGFWDGDERTLLLARDPFGIKPLYYAEPADGGGRGLLFASELRALEAGGRVRLDVDPEAVAQYLGWLSVPAPRTLYRATRSLLPGQYAVWSEAGGFRLGQSWSFRDIPPAERCTDRNAFDARLRERFFDSVRAHMLADVPVGAFLSGGIDSTLIASAMSRLSGRRLKTFSIGFEESAYSETEAARRSAAHMGAEHTAFVLTGRQVAEEIDTFIARLDQPTGDGLNTYYASKAAREGGVTVALSGLGGDELFGGYPSFRDLPRLARLLPHWLRLPRALRGGVTVLLAGAGSRAGKLADFLAHATEVDELGALQRRACSERVRTGLMAPDFRTGLAPLHPRLADMRLEFEGAGTYERISGWELRTYMADVLLRDSDACSMSHSLELRVPFVDRPLVEWLWRQDAAFKSGGGIQKEALSRAFADLLPRDMAGRRKRGFTLPLRLWMRAELRPFVEEALSAGSVGRIGFLDTKAAGRLWESFASGRNPRSWSRVWSLAVLVSFLNRRKAP